MGTCYHCEEHVSDRFERVFGDDSGNVYACPGCSANAGIAEVHQERGEQYREDL